MTSLANRNVPLFIAFRVFFNARWYYPVMAVLFLDLGLTLEHYALLNVAWAISIVCLEVPLGTLADQLGRKKLVVLAAVLMVVEMVFFAFAPRGSVWLFPMLLLNRICSGAAEACASGADESLAYESLREEGREAEWPSVLARLMRWQSTGFFVAMLLGSAVYDPKLVQHVCDFLGLHATITHETTLRWPLYLTLGNAIVTLLITLQMREPITTGPAKSLSVRGALGQTIATGRWILHTRNVLFVMIAGFCIDSVARLFLTVGSNYYRLIQLPEASFGLIGSAFALLGIFVAGLAEKLSKHQTLVTNFAITAGVSLAGLLFAALFIPWWGVLAVVPIGGAMSLLQFFLSHYLNQFIPDSSRRATVLSFKGLCFNLAYGAVGLIFAGFTRARSASGTPDVVFMEAMHWLPWFFASLVVVVVIATPRLLPNPIKATRP